MLLVLFLLAVAVTARVTFLEQVSRLEDRSHVIAVSVTATAEAGRMDRTTIAQAIKSLPVPDDGVVAVIDVATQTVAAARGQRDAVNALVAEQMPDTITRTDVDGVRRAYASAWTSDRLCQVVIGLPQRMARERTLPMYKRNVVVAAAWYLISVIALYFFLARWIRSVRHLEGVAARVSSGDLRTPTLQPMATSELEHMQRTMTEMIVRVRELQRQVVRQERLAAIGVLVSGVAHEISNPLQSILGSAEVIQSHPDLPLAIKADLTVIQNESMRAGGIIRSLTRFTRQQPVGPGPVRLTEIVQWLTDLWRRRFQEQSINLEVDDRATRVADAVATELQQVALNFLVNAEYAVLHGGRAEHTVMVRTCDMPNGFVRFEVEDSGAGVPPQEETNLFQPFFTTKPVGEGTGLGLSVSYGIIRSYGGTIGHERGAMGGARFYFEIPARHG
jgi:signal transduction histidine kinase